MSLIIAATDFSEVSANAVSYACELASVKNAQVMVIHSFIIPVMFSDIPMPATLITDAQNDAEAQMKKLVAGMALAYPGLAIDGKVIYGDTISVLEDYAQEHKTPWLIVVGNSSASENNTWPDSTLMAAFRKLAYPVLAIPSGKGYTPVQHICFAFDNRHRGNDVALSSIRTIAQQLNAKLHVLNIQPAGDNSDQQIDADAKKALSGIDSNFHVVSGADDIDNAIQEFTEQNGIDWLILLPRKHSFFEGLFHKSHTKAIAHHSKIPILAIHDVQS